MSDGTTRDGRSDQPTEAELIDFTRELLDTQGSIEPQHEPGTLSVLHTDYLTRQAIDVALALALGVRTLASPADTAGLGDVWERWANFPAILFPWTSPTGRVEYQVRPDDPTPDRNGRPRKYVFRKGMVPVLWAIRPGGPGIPGRIDGGRVLIVEGTKQALAAASCAPPDVEVYGIAGCRSWQHDGVPIGDLGIADGRDVVVVLDADAAGNPEVYAAGMGLAGALAAEGAASVKFTRLAAAGKSGLDDVLAARAPDRRAAYLARMIETAKAKPADKAPRPRKKQQLPPEGGEGRITLVCNRDRFEVINDLTAALIGRWDGRELFNHGGVISRLKGSRMYPVDRGLSKDLIQETAITVNEVETAQGTSYDYTWPDSGSIEATLSRAEKFSPLERVAHAPFVRPDGTIVTAPGYDEATRTMLVPDPELAGIEVPELPTQDEVSLARELILQEWLGDFPFDTDADRANALALVVTPAIRGLVPRVPLAVVDGLQMGVGKNLLADSLLTVYTGEPARPMNFVDEREELRKQITSAFRTGAEFFVFDEAHTIDGAALAQALTASTWQDRILGVSTMAEFPNKVTWISLGNQVQVRGDLTRRVYRIALRPTYANPQDRPAHLFRHPGQSGLDLGSWTRRNRRQLVTAILTLVRAWFAAGQPYPERSISFGSFEAWERIAGGIVATTGLTGFLDNLTVWRSESDFDSQYWTAHLSWLIEQFGNKPFRTAEVKAKAMADPAAYLAPPRLDDPTERGYGKSLGEAYSRLRGRRYDDMWIEKMTSTVGHVSLWQVSSGSPTAPLSPLAPPVAPVDDKGYDGDVGDPEEGDKGGASSEVPGTGHGRPGDSARRTDQDDRAREAGAHAGTGAGDGAGRNGDAGGSGAGVVLGEKPVRELPDAGGDRRPDPGPSNSLRAGAEAPGADPQEDDPGGQAGPWLDSAVTGRLSMAWGYRYPDAAIVYGARPTLKTPEPGWYSQCRHPECPGHWRTGLPSEREAQQVYEQHWAEAHSELKRQGEIARTAGQGMEACEAPWGPSLPSVELVTFDLEAGSADDLYRNTDPHHYVRLAGWALDDGRVEVADEDPDAEARIAIGQGAMVTGHNIMAFDLPALVRADVLSMETVHEMARTGRVFDALLVARHLDPPMARDKGVDEQRKYDLDNLAQQLGLGEKSGAGKALAKKYGGWDKIPIDPATEDGFAFRAYLVQDVRLSRKVYHHQLSQLDHVIPDYLVREHRVAALAAQISHNGFLVDQELLTQRVQEINDRKSQSLAVLCARYRVPAKDGKGKAYKAPLATNAGKAAVEQALQEAGATSLWHTAKTGQLDMSGEHMLHLASEYHHLPAVREICKHVYRIVGARSVYETVAKHLCPDGRVHPNVSFKQATGRWSLTSPGLTVMGKRGGRHVEREIFLPDPGEVVMAFDLAQVDMRGVAGCSQDLAYIQMLMHEDPHSEIAKLLFGDVKYRERAKTIGHGWNYGRGIKAISEGEEIAPGLVRQFDTSMRERFPRLVQWQDEVRAIAESGQLLDNGFGRPMRADPHRAHTQGPALMGQGAARDIMMESLLRLADAHPETLPMLRAQVHDEIVLSVPVELVEDVRRAVVEAMTWEWKGVPILGDASPTGKNWGEVYAK